MTDDNEQTFVDRLSRQGEEALGKIAEELIANSVVCLLYTSPSPRDRS